MLVVAFAPLDCSLGLQFRLQTLTLSAGTICVWYGTISIEPDGST